MRPLGLASSEWRSFVSSMVEEIGSFWQLTITLLLVVLHHGGNYGILARAHLKTPTDNGRAGEFRRNAAAWRHRDILPLPAPCLDGVFEVVGAGLSEPEPQQAAILLASVRLWSTIVSLNSEFSNQQIDSVFVCNRLS